nr:hypothetical protein TetV2_00434 [Oceanusvirus sp.]
MSETYPVYMVGSEIKHRPDIIRMFTRSPNWRVLPFDPFDYDESVPMVMRNKAGAPIKIRNVHRERVEGTVLFDCNPYGLNGYNGYPGERRPLKVMFNSLCTSLHDDRLISCDVERWRRQAVQLNLTCADKWAIKPVKTVVLLLPKAGGWKNMLKDVFVAKYAAQVKRIHGAHPDYKILLREHPATAKAKRGRNKNSSRDIVTRCLDEGMDSSKIGIDTGPLNKIRKRARAVFADWGSAAVQAVMQGVPVFNVGDRPSELVCHYAAITDLDALATLETHEFRCTPEECMGYLASFVFTRDEFDSGAVLRHIERYFSAVSEFKRDDERDQD